MGIIEKELKKQKRINKVQKNILEIIKSAVLVASNALKTWIFYKKTKINETKKNQALDHRVGPMIKLVRNYFFKPIKALEIGTWYGEGSTKIWLNELPEGSDLICIDSWKPYVSESDKKDAPKSYINMDKEMLEALASTVVIVVEHEKKPRINVSVVRASSSRFLKDFKGDSFDFIYIDGSHYYHDMMSDIQDAKRLSKNEFSVICGDDLEKILSKEEYYKYNHEKYIHIDFVDDFHPGVSLAVRQEFGVVNVDNGFWWIFKRNGVYSLT